jgi:hypothetical protein
MMADDPSDLLQRLGTAHQRVAAAEALLRLDAPLTGSPPSALISAFAQGEAHLHPPLLSLARAWPRSEMSRAVLDALHEAKDEREKEELAWVLKRVLAAEHSPEVIRLVRSAAESVEVRRWLLEGLERLAAGGALGWTELGVVVEALAEDRAASMREALASLLMTLPWRDENEALLAPLLRDPDPVVVASAARTLAGYPDAVRRIDPDLLQDLRRHGSPLINRAAADLDQALEREARPP